MNREIAEIHDLPLEGVNDEMIRSGSVFQLAVLHANLPLSTQRKIESELQSRSITKSIYDLINDQNDREQKFADCVRVIVGM